jgi:hypothetical protein
MAVRIVVENGPDKGKSLVLDARADVRIGRGPGNHLMVQDPAWQGTLRVSINQGVCKVTNQSPTTMYLGEKTFTPGEQRAWFHGESLQPTAQTLLVLYIDDPTKAAATRPSKSRKTLQLIVILVCLPLAAVLFLLPTDPGTEQPRTPEEMQQEYRRLETKLGELQDDAEGGEAAKKVVALLKEARFQQTRKHPAQAFVCYHRVRAEVESTLDESGSSRPLPENLANTLREVLDFVNQQLIELGPEARKK